MNKKISDLKYKLTTEEKHDFDSLRQLVEVLRSEDGCPWDAEQTHASIRTDLIEETYEAIEGIDKDDMVLLREELGDVMFQVLFHSRIEEEKGGFTVDDVIHDICHKMIVRHPHVFGDVVVDGSAQVLKNWEAIKTVEKSRDTAKSKMEAVPKQYPALIRAKKVAKKARAAGYNFGSAEELCAKLQNLTASLAGADEEERQSLLTEIIFASVQLAGNEADVEKNLGDLVTSFIDSYPEE